MHMHFKNKLIDKSIKFYKNDLKANVKLTTE